MHMVNSPLCVSMKRSCETQYVKEASQFFFMVVLALLVSLARPNQCQCGSLSVSDPRWCRLGLTCKTTLLILSGCLYASVNRLQSAFMLFRPQAVCLTSLYRFHVVQAACKPFS